MRYTLSNTINRPIDEVVEKFRDTDGAKEWMETLDRYERVSGTPGEVGAKTDFIFLNKGKEFVIHETILEQNLPHQIKFAFDSKMGYNEVEMLFESLPDGNTKQTNNSYFKLTGFMKVMGIFFGGMFKKQTMKMLDGFKAYCER